MAVNEVHPSRAMYGTSNSFMMYMRRSKVYTIAAPINVRLNRQRADGSWISDMRPILDFGTDNMSQPLIGEMQASSITPDVFWNNREDGLVIPFLPYVSKCHSFDAHVTLFHFTQDRRFCKLYEPKNSDWVNQWEPFSSPTENTDRCTVTLNCKFEEDLRKISASPTMWFMLPPGAVLYYISRDAYAWEDFMRGSTDPGFWSSKVGSSELTAVQVRHGEDIDPNDIISNRVPRQITLRIQYYQRSQIEKRIVQSSLELSRLDVPGKRKIDANGQEVIIRAEDDNDYHFTIIYEALSYNELVNLFAFDPPVFFILYFLVGFGMMINTAFFWGIHRLFTQLAEPPKFRFRAYLKLVTRPTVAGFFIAICPIVGGFAVMMAVFVVWDPYKLISADWSFSVETDTDRQDLNRSGRIAVTLLVKGVFLVQYVARVLISGRSALLASMQERRRASGEAKVKMDVFGGWEPDTWKLSHMFVALFMEVLLATIVLEFSFSAFFNKNVWTMLVFFELAQSVLQHLLDSLVKENMLTVPLHVATTMIFLTSTMGANDFLQFIESYFMCQLLMVAHRAYIGPGFSHLLNRIDFVRRYVKRLIAKYRKSQYEQDSDDDLDSDDDEEALMLLGINEASPVEDILESMSEYTIDAITSLMAPFIFFFYQYMDSAILFGEMYSIRRTDFVFYVLFQLVMALFTMAIDIVLHNVQELFHGWKVYEYLKYAEHRFARRSVRWKAAEEGVDESLRPQFRTIDHFCFSSQFYMIVTLVAFGVLYCIYGVQILIRQNFNPFQDRLFLGVVLQAIAICKFLEILSQLIGRRLLWKLPPREDAISDEDLLREDDLAEAEWDQKKAQISNDTTSETFKRRFLDDNKPWILEQLRNQLSPRKGDQANIGVELADLLAFKPRGAVDISDDEGSDGDENLVRPPGIVGQVIAARWLDRTKRRLGLQSRAPQRQQLSDDSDSEAEYPTRGGEMTPTARAIAKEWLQSMRGAQKPVREDTSDDGLTTDTEASRREPLPRAAAEIAKTWLAQIRNEPIGADSDELSDGGSAEDVGPRLLLKPGLSLSEPTKDIANQWLRAARVAAATGSASGTLIVPGRKRPPRSAELVEESSGSSSDDKPAGPSKAPMTEPAKEMARAWLSALRNKQ
jgi:hypothetical protein